MSRSSVSAWARRSASGRVAVVEEVGHVGEGQRRREGRRRGRLDRHQPHRPRPDPGQQLGQRGQVEDVAQALPVGLQEDRELAVLRRHRQQVGRPLPHLPQRACAGPAGAGAGAGPGPRSPGTGRRTAPSWPARPPPAPRPRRGRRRPCRRAATSSASGRRTTMPSSLHMVCTSSPSRSRTRASMASAHGACTRPPKGDSTHTRQSPSSSRKRSTTIWRSVGSTPPVTDRSSSR